ncbi:uncharacterized protein LOC122806904 [Protopterus annectens]|uniref:uncharacterized protein LOC122806904 n=1 Tax=Protopterus annectens TaxID=7888 RepID=UPI001CFAD8BA|nr:uncharacterized protein LOC122806904 [Protopterus annectens]XP_043933646.1 uncharacterized protein LOC122806904 [Protopterus annectens]
MCEANSETIELATLGRPFRLGMLYDCRSDTLIPAVTLWDPKKLNEFVDRRPQHNTDFHILTSDSYNKKASSMHLSPAVTVSLLGGMINVKGSANFFQDKMTSKNQARVTMMYRTTTKFEQLTMEQLGHVDYSYVIEDGTATHVVTGILFGAQAFFIFDRKVSTDEKKDTIQGSLEVCVNLGPMSCGGGGSTSVELKNENTHNIQMQDIKCTFYGDFKLGYNPVSFVEAMEVYKKLPELLGPKEENAVPVRAWLYPLKLLDSKAAKIVHEISVDLVHWSQDVLEQLTSYEMRCNDLMKDPMAAQFKVLKKKVKCFKDQCHVYKLMFQKALAFTLPSIRGGILPESYLKSILKSIEQSPFNSCYLDSWLDDKEAEMNVVRAYLKMMNDMKVLPKKSDLEEIVLDPMNEYAICFSFTSLHLEDPFLTCLSRYLQGHPFKEEPQNNESSSYEQSKETWYNSPSLTQRVRAYAKRFLEFAAVNVSCQKTKFFISYDTSNTAPEGASIFFYEEGVLKTMTFNPPSKPDTPEILSITHNSVSLKLKPPKHGTEYLEKYEIEYKDNQGRGSSCYVSGQSTDCIVTGLHPNTIYQFQYKAVCKPGCSVTSERVENIRTLPLSPPFQLSACEVGPDGFQLTWEAPKEIADDVSLKGYNIQYAEEKGSPSQDTDKEVVWTEVKTKTLCKFDVRKTKPDTVYRVRIFANAGKKGLSLPSEEIIVKTFEDWSIDEMRRKYTYVSSVTRKEEPSIYQLPSEVKIIDKEKNLKKCVFGKSDANHYKKTILFIGAIGSGKTTLVDAMVNYILGVKWEDSFRFQLTAQNGDSTHDVTVYEINYQNGFKIPYCLSIIDTPGFGEWHLRGQMITEQVRSIFKMQEGVECLDAICYVLPASENTSCEYLFCSPLFEMVGQDDELSQCSLFNAHLVDNALFLFTFADTDAYTIIKEKSFLQMRCQERDDSLAHAAFNNSVLFEETPFTGDAANKNEAAGKRDVWSKNWNNMATFFNHLNNTEGQKCCNVKNDKMGQVTPGNIAEMEMP